MKQLVITVVLAVFFGACSGAIATKVVLGRPTDTIVTKHLAIVDDSGGTRASLGTDSQGEVLLEFRNPGKVPQLSIGVTRKDSRPGQDRSFDRQSWAPVIDFREESGRVSALFTTTSKGNSALTFYGEGGSSRMELGYIGLGSDSGKRFSAWGVRALKGDNGTAFGVFDDAPYDGERFLAPALDGFGKHAYFAGHDYYSPTLQRNSATQRKSLDKK